MKTYRILTTGQSGLAVFEVFDVPADGFKIDFEGNLVLYAGGPANSSRETVAVYAKGYWLRIAIASSA